MKISEIFYSLQGEGSRAGSANIFIRVSGCKAKFACAAQGIKCDTEFESGIEMSKEEIHDRIRKFPCLSIIWTGGEPADRITDEVAKYFRELGYFQAIETSGLFPVSDSIDFISISPKVAEHVIEKNFPHGCDELRYVRHSGQAIPEPSIMARHRYISPHSDGWNINRENLDHCIQLVKENPSWSLSIQQHKIWSVL